MPRFPPTLPKEESIVHFRWSRTEENLGFFIDEDRLRAWFYVIAAAGTTLLACLLAGLWRLQQAALAPPTVVGIAHGLVFSGPTQPISSILDDDFDVQFSDTVEVLFGRTEKGLPPEIGDFCAPEVVTAIDQAYHETASKYPAGYVQTLAVLESKNLSSRPGYRRIDYRGLLSSRSLAASQTSPIYLDCIFSIGRPTALNISGWRLVHAEAIGRDDYYRDERERAVRQALSLPPAPHP